GTPKIVGVPFTHKPESEFSGAWRLAPGAWHLNQTASDKLVKLKSLTFSTGITTSPPASVPATRAVVPMPSRLFNMNNGDSLKRRFFTDFVISPFSIRNVPSRVRPVYNTVRGST